MVNVAGNLANHWRYVSDPRTVQYEVKTGPSTFDAPLTVEKVLRRALTKEDLELDGSLLQHEGVVYHLWLAKLDAAGGIVPKVNDRITEGGVVRYVKRREVMDEGQRYRLTCSTAIR